MNSYTVHFRFAHEHVDATDTDMAVMQASKIIAQDLTDEERGELVAVELHGKNGMSDFFYAGTDLSSDEVDEVINREAARAPAVEQQEEPLPPRRARGLFLTREFCDIEKKWQFFVVRFNFSASLNAAYNEEELMGGRFGDTISELSRADMDIVREWQHNEERYIAQAEAETGLIEQEQA